ncbi:FecR family protein [Chitinophaga sp. 22321]|uniref:FecR domain-containing protein n=1 Tax=Chitinophaga hostae TaxID=2831022 RepID=A0ABS5J0W6_9BACT|nr:FecR domain-containing protein [Chitinophaga hostae]MBS0028883.1 FecR domain-containing protein [Chitinophaga hostae]
MKFGKKQLKLEDLLGNDHVPPGQNDDPSQQELAAAVQQMIIGAGKEEWDPADKEALWQDIAVSLVPRQRSYRYLYMKVAAAVLLLVAVGGWLFWPRQQSALVQFAQRQAPMAPSADTRLIPGQGNAVVVKGKNSSLIYSGNNNGITINEAHTEIPEAAFNTLMVPYGRRSRVQLEDGTVVLLNAGSRLVYPASFKENKREVYLEGEAFFDIAPNAQSPFFVYASGIETEVLGTSFNISAYPDDAQQSLVLATGSVRVRSQDHGLFGKHAQQLQPRDMAVVNRKGGEVQVSQVNVATYTAWKDGRLLFYSTPLKEILKKLTRYYNIQLELAVTQPGLKTCSGDLDLEENLDNVLEVICATNSLRYERFGQRIVLKEKE